MLVTEFGPQQTLAVRRPPALGRVFYVDGAGGTGADTNNGIDPGTPFLTIDHALGQCVNGHNDYIIVLDCFNQDAFPILVDVTRVHIIGVTSPTAALWPQLAGGGLDIFSLTAASHYCEIAGFGFQSALAAGITIAGADRVWIHHCEFAQAGAALQDGIIGTAGDSPSHSLIEDCYFGSAITRDGYRGNATNTTFRNNIFRDCAGIGINHGGVEVGAIYGNYFFHALALTPAIGWAITLVAGANGGLIMGNHASQSIDNAGTNPYRDVDGVNGWSENWTGNALINPNTG